MSGQNFNWNLVSCLIGLVNYNKVKVIDGSGGLVTKENTDGTKKSHSFSACPALNLTNLTESTVSILGVLTVKDC